MSAQEEGDRPGLRAKLLTSVAILATLGCGLALTVWKVDAPPAALLRGPYRRPQQAAQPDPPPLDAETLTSIAEEASWTATWALPEGAPMSLGMSQAVGPWKAGDPWPGGVVCPNGKLTDAFHLKPEVDCEPNCVECTMVCLPSAYVGPFEKRGGQLGSSCFERGCTAYKGSGSQMGVSFHTYACDPALQAEWYEKNAPLSEEGAKQNLAECLAACRRRDKPCRLQCEADHKDELAQITLRQHAASGFMGEHSDAYQTAAAMGFALLCAACIGIGGCFAIHTHHTGKAEGKSGKSAKGAVLPTALGATGVQIDSKVVQIATGLDGQLCALTEDGRVYTWSASDATKARGALEPSLARDGVEGGRQLAPRPLSTQLSTPTRASAQPLSETPKSPGAAPKPRGAKQSISDLKKSVNTIRAIS